jgi:hypothetical protein
MQMPTKKRPSPSLAWPSALAFVLALPLVASLAACDTSSKPSSTCAGGKTGLAAAATCMTPTTPGGMTPAPGAMTPTMGSPLAGDWGRTVGANAGEVWTFEADGSYAVVVYSTSGTQAQIEITFQGKFSAANGQLMISAEASTCAYQAGQFSLPYSVSGNALSVTLGDKVYVYTKGNAPNPASFTQTTGCFDSDTGAFTPGALHAL